MKEIKKHLLREGDVTGDKNSCVYSGVQIQEIQIDELKSQLNDRQINKTGPNVITSSYPISSHLTVVNKYTF